MWPKIAAGVKTADTDNMTLAKGFTREEFSFSAFRIVSAL